MTVTQYAKAVENASVKSAAAGLIAENYTTDANGAVVLGQPEDDVNVTITATEENSSAETTVTLSGTESDIVVDQREDGVSVTVTDGDDPVENATVEIQSNDDYSGAGTYASGADGTVVFPLPTENVSIGVTATDANESVSTTADLTVDLVEEEPFGLAVSQFVSALQNATVEGPLGQIISDCVTANSHGNAGSTPGNATEAPGQSGDDADDGNEATEDDSPTAGNGSAPDETGLGSEAGADRDFDNEEDGETETETSESSSEESDLGDDRESKSGSDDG